MSQETYSSSQAAPTSSMSVISLVAGILGISLFPFLGSIIALITGYMAKKEIRESSGTIGGDGMATAGIILGWFGFVLTICCSCAFGILMLVPLCLLPFGFSTMDYYSTFMPLLQLFF
jgi:hypothetical protein